MTITKIISGWGGYPKQEAQIINPSSCSDLKIETQKQKSFIPRGMGRSYGDSASAQVVLETSYYDHMIEFDVNKGYLKAEAGITFKEILNLIVPKGWFLPVTPGTSFVTLGGAIASDVHGKNHHNAGTFAQHVKSMSVLLGTGDVITASQTENIDFFRATCGGMGLTGVIISATIQLIPIQSSFINQKTIKADCIEAACEAFENNSSAKYSVAWIDCLARGKGLGRSVLMLGEHAESGDLELAIKDPISMPIYTPAVLLNRITMKAFNGAYWYKAKHNHLKKVPLMSYFYPLDAIGSWNKVYGRAGFLQYQFVIPKADGVTNMHKILAEIVKSGEQSFFAVLKQFGEANDNFLSFPISGYTLALDFKFSMLTIKLLNRLDDLVKDMGGRVYLTKDAVMQETIFKATYPKWQEFEDIRQKYGAIGKFSSAQSKRLGLQ